MLKFPNFAIQISLPCKAVHGGRLPRTDSANFFFASPVTHFLLEQS